MPSAQMLGAGTAYRSAAVKSHLYNTRILHAYAAMCLRRTIPSEYDKAKPIYDAGKWISEDSPDGIALGQAILWKLQVAIHRDTQDGLGNFCIAFNFGRWVPDGMFGGGMAFPDLGLMFEYVLLFCLSIETDPVSDIHLARSSSSVRLTSSMASCPGSQLTAVVIVSHRGVSLGSCSLLRLHVEFLMVNLLDGLLRLIRGITSIRYS